MAIDYYGIKGCTLKTVDGVLALLAPEDTGEDEDVLRLCGFVFQDGRWMHFLTQEEYRSLFCPKSSESRAPAYLKIPLFIISVLLMIGAVLSAFAAENIPLAILLYMGAVIIAIVLNVREPKNTAGRILVFIYLLIGIAAVIQFIHAVNLCVEDCNHCLNCEWNKCGR